MFGHHTGELPLESITVRTGFHKDAANPVIGERYFHRTELLDTATCHHIIGIHGKFSEILNDAADFGNIPGVVGKNEGHIQGIDTDTAEILKFLADPDRTGLYL